MPDAHESCRKAPSQPHKCSRFILYSRRVRKIASGNFKNAQVYQFGPSDGSKKSRRLVEACVRGFFQHGLCRSLHRDQRVLLAFEKMRRARRFPVDDPFQVSSLFHCRAIRAPIGRGGVCCLVWTLSPLQGLLTCRVAAPRLTPVGCILSLLRSLGPSLFFGSFGAWSVTDAVCTGRLDSRFGLSPGHL